MNPGPWSQRFRIPRRQNRATSTAASTNPALNTAVAATAAPTVYGGGRPIAERIPFGVRIAPNQSRNCGSAAIRKNRPVFHQGTPPRTPSWPADGACEQGSDGSTDPACRGWPGSSSMTPATDSSAADTTVSDRNGAPR